MLVGLFSFSILLSSVCVCAALADFVFDESHRDHFDITATVCSFREAQYTLADKGRYLRAVFLSPAQALI